MTVRWEMVAFPSWKPHPAKVPLTPPPNTVPRPVPPPAPTPAPPVFNGAFRAYMIPPPTALPRPSLPQPPVRSATLLLLPPESNVIEPVPDVSDTAENPNDILLDDAPRPATTPVPTEVSRKELDYHDARDRARTLRVACMHNGIAAALDYWYNKRPVPYLSGVVLRDYQVRIMNWMALREKYPVHGVRGGFIAPEMGLGKTLITSSYCLWAKRPEEGPTLIIASLNVLKEWRKHFATFYEPDVLAKRVVFLHKLFNPNTHLVRRAHLVDKDIVLTTYDMLLGSYRHLAKHYPDDADSCIEYQNPEKRKRIVAMHVRTAAHVRTNAAVTGVNLIHQGMLWGRLVCDESQTIANPLSRSFRAALAVAAPRRWGISGTMVRNYVWDIWAQLRYAGYNKVACKRLWTQRSAPHYYRSHGISALIYALTYEQAGVTLPPFVEETVHLTLSKRERDIYAMVEAKARKIYLLSLQKKISSGSMRTMVTRLRQCCIALSLMNGNGAIDELAENLESEFGSEGAAGDDDDDDEHDSIEDSSLDRKKEATKKRLRDERASSPNKRIKTEAVCEGGGEEEEEEEEEDEEEILFKSTKEILDFCRDMGGDGGIHSTKIRATVAIVTKHLARSSEDKIIVFSMFAKALALVAEAFAADPALSKEPVITVDGSVIGEERDAYLEQFRANPAMRILCIQGKIGGEGLNLQHATGGLPLEPHWTFQAKRQQRRRFWRLGQTRPTYWYDLIVDDTIEQRVIEICEQKMKLEEEFKNRKRGRPVPDSQTTIFGQLLGFK